MMTTVENPQYTIKELEELMNKVKSNHAKEEDYRRLNKFLTLKGLTDYLDGRLRYYSYSSYEDFIDSRNNNNSNPELIGEILGMITALKTII